MVEMNEWNVHDTSSTTATKHKKNEKQKLQDECSVVAMAHRKKTIKDKIIYQWTDGGRKRNNTDTTT